MEKKITGYTTVDISQWHRKEHFEAFQSVAQCTYNQTVQLDITAFLKTVKKNKHKFYPAFIHILARLMNAHPEFMGKYYTQGDKVLMPLAIQVHHAVCDGFHVGRMLNELQQYCDEWQGGA